MAYAVAVLFDQAADTAVRELWSRVGTAPTHPPHLVFAAAADIPQRTRTALRTDLRVLHIPRLWFATLSTLGADALALTAVADAELLAVHSAVHDALAGKVRHPDSRHLPGNWIPHCPLLTGATRDELAGAFTALLPPKELRARTSQVVVLDTVTGEADPLT